MSLPIPILIAFVIVIVLAAPVLPLVCKAIVDFIADLAISRHDQRTRFVLAQMKLIDAQCEREIAQAQRHDGRNNA